MTAFNVNNTNVNSAKNPINNVSIFIYESDQGLLYTYIKKGVGVKYTPLFPLISISSSQDFRDFPPRQQAGMGRHHSKRQRIISCY